MTPEHTREHELIRQHVLEQAGLDIEPDAYFTEPCIYKGKYAYAFDIGERSWLGQRFALLSRLAEYSSVIEDVQPAGVTRVTITMRGETK